MKGRSPRQVRGRHLRLMADLSEWLGGRGLGPEALTEAMAREFGDARPREGRGLWPVQVAASPAGVLLGAA
jgi:hypothetical protein